MGYRIDSSFKEKLMDLGLWGDFIRRRDDVKVEFGCGVLRANKIALSEFVEQGKLPSEFSDVTINAPRKAKAVKEEAVREKAAVAPKVAPAQKCVAKSEGEVVRKDTFAGKSCSFLKSFLWAYENVRVVDAVPADAPSAVAWSLLLDMRSSPSLRADLAKAALTKSISKTDDDESVLKKFDGEAEYDLLAALAEGAGG